MSLREATRNSVNLVFIRLMRDIERYYMFHIPGSSANILKDIDDPLREKYLKRFRRQGRQGIHRALLPQVQRQDSAGRSTIFSMPASGQPRAGSRQLTVTSIRTSHRRSSRHSWKHACRASEVPGAPAMQSLYDAYAPGKYGLADQGYIAHVHPLELWLVRYLTAHPGAQLQGRDPGQRRRAHRGLWLAAQYRAQERAGQPDSQPARSGGLPGNSP